MIGKTNFFRGDNQQTTDTRPASKRLAVPSPATLLLLPGFLVRCRYRPRNHKSRRGLRGKAFGIPSFTPKAEIHDGCVCRSVWNSPIEILGFRVQPGANPHSECAPAIQRQPNFLLASRQIYVGKRGLPFDSDFLPRIENLPNPRRN